MPHLRHHLRGSATPALLVQQPLWRLPDLPRVRQRDRARHGAGRAGPRQVRQPGRHRAVDQAALPLQPGGVEAHGQAARRTARPAVAGPDGRGAHAGRRRRRRRLRRRSRLLPVARAEEVQGPRPRVPQPLPRLPDMPGMRRHAPPPGSARRPGRRSTPSTKSRPSRSAKASASSTVCGSPRRTPRSSTRYWRRFGGGSGSCAMSAWST